MSELEDQLLRALLELEETVNSASHPQFKSGLSVLLERVDALAAALPEETDPRLRHYVANKSYQKARLLLQGREAENQAGRCRPSP
jgi:hypothetical protein